MRPKSKHFPFWQLGMLKSCGVKIQILNQFQAFHTRICTLSFHQHNNTPSDVKADFAMFSLYFLQQHVVYLQHKKFIQYVSLKQRNVNMLKYIKTYYFKSISTNYISETYYIRLILGFRKGNGNMQLVQETYYFICHFTTIQI